MQVVEITDAHELASRARGPLRRDEPGNALPLGVLGHIEAGRVSTWRGAIVVADDGVVAGSLLHTAPWPWSVTSFGVGRDDDVAGAAAEFLAATASGEDVRIVGPRTVADPTAAALAAVVDGHATVDLAMRRMACREVTWRPSPPGEVVRAHADDAEELVDWLTRFHAEATPSDPPVDAEELLPRLRERLARPTPSFWWWVDGGERVSLAAIGSPAGTGERISSVYTPPAARGRGYAGAVVAHATEDAFARGCSWVGLFTDASNPVSNRVYAKLGYADIGDAAVWRVATSPRASAVAGQR